MKKRYSYLVLDFVGNKIAQNDHVHFQTVEIEASSVVKQSAFIPGETLLDITRSYGDKFEKKGDFICRNHHLKIFKFCFVSLKNETYLENVEYE